MPSPFAPIAFSQFSATFLLVGAAVLIGMLAQIAIAVRDLVLGRGSASWSAVDGVITDSGVVRRGTRNPYRAAIAYRYTVEGRTYRGQRRHYGAEGSYLPAGAAAIAARYPVGAVVTIYHHPTRPGLAVLEPGVVLADALMRLGQAALGLVLLMPFLRLFLSAMPFLLAR
ncbi:MAG TPA: DUF3592 domain-containing protein [Thermomicrobiales bacterium]